MSVDLNWETVTGGPDGDVLADRIRTFIHEKFQTVPLPRFIKSVTVHGFDFGTVPPRLDLKDITDPLPEFYEAEIDDDDEEEDNDDEEDSDHGAPTMAGSMHEKARWTQGGAGATARKRPGGLRTEDLRANLAGQDLGSPFLGTSTPGILGGPGLNYFQSHMAGGGTGTQTPLAAVAGAHLGGNNHHHAWHASSPDSELYSPSHSRNPSQSSISVDNFHTSSPRQGLREKSSVSTLAPTSAATSRPPTRDTHLGGESAIEDDEEEGEDGEPVRPRKEPKVEDVQAVLRIQYSGDIHLNLTAEILLDYPMPSFVGIPLKLNITGLSFDGIGILANIRKRVHFCFLSPEDAMTAVGPDAEDDEDSVRDGSQQKQQQQAPPGGGGGAGKKSKPRFGGLLQEIKVESEIGERHGGKQSLKNVGKVERFVLEQVRRIFEEEFVYPSFWTFLV